MNLSVKLWPPLKNVAQCNDQTLNFLFAFQFLGKRTEIACKYLKMQLRFSMILYLNYSASELEVDEKSKLILRIHRRKRIASGDDVFSVLRQKERNF